MKKIFSTLALVISLMFFVSTNANAMGLFYTDASYPVTATGTTVQDLSKLKSGSSSCVNILGVVEVGDAGIDKAVKSANIKKISFIDINEKTVFVFFRKLSTTVYGE